MTSQSPAVHLPDFSGPRGFQSEAPLCLRGQETSSGSHRAHGLVRSRAKRRRVRPPASLQDSKSRGCMGRRYAAAETFALSAVFAEEKTKDSSLAELTAISVLSVDLSSSECCEDAWRFNAAASCQLTNHPAGFAGAPPQERRGKPPRRLRRHPSFSRRGSRSSEASYPMCLRKNSSMRERATFALSAWNDPRWSQLKPWPAG